MSKQNDPHKKVNLLSGLKSYRNFKARTETIINSFDDQIVEIYEIDKDLTKILEVIKMHKIPGIDLTEQSIYALILSIMTNTKSNRTHFIALKAQVMALNKFMNLSNSC